MKKVVVILFALFTGVVVYAQKVKPSSNVVNEQRTVLNFSQLVVSNGIEVFVVTTGSEKIEIQAPDNVIQYVEAVVEKEVLNIRFRKGFKLNGNATIKVTVNVKSLTSLSASNQSKIVLSNALTTEKLDVTLNNSSLSGLIAVSKKLSISLDKAAQADLSGTCKELKMSLTGASTLGSTSLTADVVSAKLSGQSTARLTIAQSVEFTGAKESSLYYLGSPTIKKSSGKDNSKLEQIR
jgi:hypothetical protein